jgi:hypothetical protein
VTSLELAASKLVVTLLPVDIKSAGDLEGAFADMKKSGAQVIFVTGAALVLSLAKPIADLALAARLPSYIQGGGCGRRIGEPRPRSHGNDASRGCSDRQDHQRHQPVRHSGRAAHQIRAGHQSEDHPLAEPGHPPSLLALADEVIE